MTCCIHFATKTIVKNAAIVVSSDIYLGVCMSKTGNFPLFLGEFDGGMAFVDFINSTDQKINHTLLMEVLQNELLSIFDAQKPVNFVDLASGDGEQSSVIVDRIANEHGGGLNYVGFDIDDRFVKSTKEQILALDNPKIMNIQVLKSDIFSDTPDIPKNLDNTMATIGHVLYYGKEKLPQFARNLKSMLGDNNSICDLTHNSPDCEMSTIRTQFEKGIIAQPTKDFAEAAIGADLEVKSFIATAKLHFPSLGEEQWSDMESPNAWLKPVNSNNLAFKKALSLVSFVVQQGLPVPSDVQQSDRVQNTPRLSQADYISTLGQIKSLLLREDKPYVEVQSEYQIVYPAKSKNSELGAAVLKAIDTVKSQLDDIRLQAELQYRPEMENFLRLNYVEDNLVDKGPESEIKRISGLVNIHKEILHNPDELINILTTAENNNDVINSVDDAFKITAALSRITSERGNYGVSALLFDKQGTLLLGSEDTAVSGFHDSNGVLKRYTDGSAEKNISRKFFDHNQARKKAGKLPLPPEEMTLLVSLDCSAACNASMQKVGFGHVISAAPNVDLALLENNYPKGSEPYIRSLQQVSRVPVEAQSFALVVEVTKELKQEFNNNLRDLMSHQIGETSQQLSVALRQSLVGKPAKENVSKLLANFAEEYPSKGNVVEKLKDELSKFSLLEDGFISAMKTVIPENAKRTKLRAVALYQKGHDSKTNLFKGDSASADTIFQNYRSFHETANVVRAAINENTDVNNWNGHNPIELIANGNAPEGLQIFFESHTHLLRSKEQYEELAALQFDANNPDALPEQLLAMLVSEAVRSKEHNNELRATAVFDPNGKFLFISGDRSAVESCLHTPEECVQKVIDGLHSSDSLFQEYFAHSGKLQYISLDEPDLGTAAQFANIRAESVSYLRDREQGARTSGALNFLPQVRSEENMNSECSIDNTFKNIGTKDTQALLNSAAMKLVAEGHDDAKGVVSHISRSTGRRL
jgi:hypothetical protein